MSWTKEQIAQTAIRWAKECSLTSLRKKRRRDGKTEAIRECGLTKAQAWKIRNLAISIKRAERRYAKRDADMAASALRRGARGND